MRETGRIAVIGAGVMGACIAYYLTREGADVLLVDAGQPGQLTTSASFAWTNASSKAGDSTYFDLNAAGVREYEHLVADFADAGWWNPTGHLRWDYRDEHELERVVQVLRARDYPLEVWDVERAQRLEPRVEMTSPSGRGVLFPAEAWVDGPRMVESLVASIVARGGTTAFENAVRSVGVSENAVASIELMGGEKHSVDAVVNAAGPGAADVSALVGRALPLRTKPGLAVRVETPEAPVSRVLHAPGVSIRPDGAGRAFLSARQVEPELERGAHDAKKLAEEVRRLAARVVPELAEAPIVDVRVGHRPIPADGFSLIGKAAAIGGYYEAVTHSGITLAPIVARALTGEILRGEIDPIVAGFPAARF